MTISEALIRRVVRLAPIASGLLMLGACGDFQHTNPLDPSVPVKLTLVGPDSATAFGDTVQFAVVTDPDYEHGPMTIDAQGLLAPLDRPGAFTVVSPTMPRLAFTIKASLDGRSTTRQFVIHQLPSRIRIIDCGTGLVTPVMINAIYARTSRCVTVVDRNGNRYLGTSPLHVVTRDSSVATPAAVSTANFDIWSLGIGSTYFLVSRDGIVDSVRVVVSQSVVSILPNPQRCVTSGLSLVVGDSVTVSRSSTGYDATGVRVRDTALVAAQSAALVWTQAPSAAVRVYANGTIVGLTQGSATVTASAPAQPSGVRASAYCDVVVR